jgi:hypothetical protein
VVRAVHLLVAGAACLLLVGASGCAKLPTPTAVTLPASAIGQMTVTADMASKGVHAPTGDLLHVVLQGTQWQFDRPAGGVLVQVGAPKITVPASCSTAPVGSGCGTVTMSYRAAKTGSTTIHASRTSCGEALRCDPAQAGFSMPVSIGHG